MNSIFNFPPTIHLTPSVQAFRAYGVSKSLVHHMLVNNWNYPESYRDTLQAYYLLYWSSDHVAKMVNEGMIFTGSEVSNAAPAKGWIVVFHKLTAGEVKNHARADRITQFKLSFREAQKEFHLPAYVLISR